eukprot:s369_g34.t1
MCLKPSVFDTFDFQLCLAPQRRALFRHRMAIESKLGSKHQSPQDLDYSPLEALLNEPGDDGEAPAVPFASDPPSPADTPMEADAVPTFDREPEVAHPSTGGLARVKSTEDMDTCQSLIDTQAGIDCAMPVSSGRIEDLVEKALNSGYEEISC